MTDIAFDPRRDGRVGVSLPGLALVVLFHAAALWLLMSLDRLPTPPQIKPIMVQMIPPGIPAPGLPDAPAETPAQPVKAPEPVKPPPKEQKPPPVKKPVVKKPPRPKPAPPAPEMIATPPAPAVVTREEPMTAPTPPEPAETPDSGAPVAEPADTDAGASGRGAGGPGAGGGASGSGRGGGGGDATQPRFDANYLDNPRPVYPPMSRRMGEEGKVFLRVRVEPDGRPSRVEIKTSSGSPRLDQAAEDAVRRWRFIPAKRGTEAITAWVIVPISFNLKQ